MILRGSVLLSSAPRLWGAFLRLCGDSASAGAARRLSALLLVLLRGSLAVSLLTRDGPLTRHWPGSLFCHALTELIHLPVTVLRACYRLLRPAVDGSTVCRLLFALDGQRIPLISWLALAVLVVPFAGWNNLYSFVAVALVFALTCVGAVRKPGHCIDLSGTGPGIPFFALFVCLSLVFSAEPSASLRFFLFHMTGMGLALLCAAATERVSQLLRLAGFGMAGLFLCSVYACYQRAVGIEVDAMMVDLTVNQDTPGRVYSVFENPNAFAVVIVLLLPVAVALLLYAPTLPFRAAMLPVIAVAGAALVMTYSRSAWIGFSVAMLLFVLLLRPGLTPFLIALGILALPLLPPSVYNRILSMFNTLDTSMSSRIPVYRAMLALAGDYPLTGVGLGNDAVRVMIDRSGHYHSETLFIHGHNIFLQIWVETGLFGLLSFCGMMLASLRAGARAVIRQGTSPLLRGLSAAGVAGLTGSLVFGLADYPWSYPRVMTVFWLAFGLLLCAGKLAGRER